MPFRGYISSHFHICYRRWKTVSKLPTVFCNTEPKRNPHNRPTQCTVARIIYWDDEQIDG
jgi:hypothetical protein